VPKEKSDEVNAVGKQIARAYSAMDYYFDHLKESVANEAIGWAKQNGHSTHVARVRHLNDKKKADHWRAA
jgi:hypothetical protein